MNGIEVLCETDEIAVVPVVARTAAALAVVNIGRARDQPEVDAVSAEKYALGRIAWSEHER